MINQFDLENKEDSKQLYYLLHESILTWLIPASISGSLICFLSSNPVLNSINFFLGTTSGVVTLIKSRKLEQLEPKIERLNKSENNRHLHLTANQELVYERLLDGLRESTFNDLEASKILQLQSLDRQLQPSYAPPFDPVVTTVTPITEGVTVAHDDVTTDSNESNDTITKDLLIDVINAINGGISDSDIIKNILKMGGTKYNQGKEKLQLIREFLQNNPHFQ